LLNSHGVEYVIVGAHALAFHGAPRFTGDIDFLIRPTEANARRIVEALNEFGFGGEGITVEDLLAPGRIIQMGVPPVRIDIITSISGVTWEQADGGKAAGNYGGVPVYFIGRREYLTNKAAARRKKDLADIEALEIRKPRRPRNKNR
jgi:hypothetical protein